MTALPDHQPSSWRVAVTRDHPGDTGWQACATLEEYPPADEEPLARAARELHACHWLVVASARAVTALARHAMTDATGAVSSGATSWLPRGLRTAAVGPATARALVEAGADPAPVVGEGAEGLWSALRGAAHWPGLCVLAPTTPGGRSLLADRLTAAGAEVNTVVAYQMRPRPAAVIRADWHRVHPEAVVITSPRSGEALVAALGAGALTRLLLVVAIGPTTAAWLSGLGVPHEVAPTAELAEVARWLRERQAREVRS